MMKYLSHRILFLTVLYIGIIFGIFALQFTNGNAFSKAIGSMIFSGATETSETGVIRPILPLHASVNGVDFFLDDQNPLIAYTAEKTAVKLKVTGISSEESGFTIVFTENVSVSFSSIKRTNADIITISALIPARYLKVAFPYKITRSSRIEKKDSLTLVNTGKKQFIFTGTAIESGNGSSIRHLAILRSSPVVYYQTYIPAKGLVIEDLPDLPRASDAAYRKAVERYASVSLASFRQSVVSGLLSEGVVASYLSEMGRIGMYRSAIELIPETYRNGASRTYLTLPFLNNLEKTYATLISREREERLELSRKLTDNNPAVFEFPSLISFLVDRGSTILLKDVTRFASVIDISTVTTRQAAGILEAAMDFAVYYPKDENVLLSLADACERRLKSAFVRIQDNMYVTDDGKTVNTLESLQIAPILIRYGSTVAEKTAWKNAGNLLVSSVVSLSGDNAILPSAYSISAGETGEPFEITVKGTVMLDPATVYPILVTGNSWYPHALSLASQAGPGVWAWTSAQSVKILKVSEELIKITVRFPQGETHYMVVRGVKPFYRILIYGLDFRTDPRFESYNSSGYVYNEQTQTLYLKMRHKVEYEDILIYTGTDSNLKSEGADSAESGEDPVNPAMSELPAQ